MLINCLISVNLRIKDKQSTAFAWYYLVYTGHSRKILEEKEYKLKEFNFSITIKEKEGKLTI